MIGAPGEILIRGSPPFNQIPPTGTFYLKLEWPTENIYPYPFVPCHPAFSICFPLFPFRGVAGRRKRHPPGFWLSMMFFFLPLHFPSPFLISRGKVFFFFAVLMAAISPTTCDILSPEIFFPLIWSDIPLLLTDSQQWLIFRFPSFGPPPFFPHRSVPSRYCSSQFLCEAPPSFDKKFWCCRPMAFFFFFLFFPPFWH